MMLIIFIPHVLFGQTGNNTESLINILSENAISFETRPLMADYGGFGSSLHVRISQGDTTGTFVLAVPISSTFAVETALVLIEAAGYQKLNFNLLVAFLGDEKSELDSTEFSLDGFSNKGLRDLITLTDMPGNWVVSYLDLNAPPKSLYILHGSEDYIAPLELVRSLPSLFKAHDIPASFEVRHNGLFKLGLAKDSEVLNLLMEGEINGIYFSSRDSINTERISVDGINIIDAKNLAMLLLDYAETLELPLQNPDRHYSLIVLGPYVFFISEKVSVILLISSIAVFIFSFMVYSISKRVILFVRIRLFIKYSWIFLIFLPLMVFFIRGTGLFYAFLLGLFQVPAPGSDFWGSILIILSALWLFYFVSLGLDLFHFPRKAGFYGASAIILAALGLITAAILDFTYTSIFIWAFTFIYLAATLKKPVLITISVFFIPLLPLLALYNVWQLQGLPVYFFIVQGSNRTWVAISQAAILCLPMILLLKRDVIFIKLKRNLRKIYIFRNLWFRLGVLIFLFSLMILQVFFLSLEKSGESRRETFEEDILNLAITETIFLESRIVNIVLHSPVNPIRFDLFLKSDNDDIPLIYSAPIPQERQNDNSIRFIMGENPPNPLELEIVLRRDFTGSFWADVIYKDDAEYFMPIYGQPVPLTRRTAY